MAPTSRLPVLSARSIRGRAGTSRVFNGDSKADILWQNDDGTPAIWTMDGTNVMSMGAAGSFNPGSDWHVIA